MSSREPSGGSVRGVSVASGARRGPVRRILIARSGYDTTGTPLSGQCFGIALPVFVATVVISLLYAVSLILILACDCEFTSPVIYFFSFLLLASLSTIANAAVNIPKYSFNYVSLTISLFYSGSAALILFGLIYISSEGLCMTSKAPVGSSTPGITSGSTSATTPGTNSGITSGTTLVTTRLPSRPIGGQPTSLPWPPDIPQRRESLVAETERVGLWSSGYAPDYCIWVFSAIGCCFQIAAHFIHR